MAPILIGPLLGQVRTTLPKVNFKISDDDSGSLEAGVAASNLDMAIVYEDEFVSTSLPPADFPAAALSRRQPALLM